MTQASGDFYYINASYVFFAIFVREDWDAGGITTIQRMRIRCSTADNRAGIVRGFLQSTSRTAGGISNQSSNTG